MTTEESIRQKLVEHLNLPEGASKIQRKRRIVIEVAAQDFEKAFQYAVKNMEFSVLCTITGLDEVQGFVIIYHMARTDGIMLNVKITISKENPVLKSIIGYFPNSDIYERELVDLLGIKVSGLPEGKRYPLPDDWPEGQYPLRKDWKKESLKKNEVRDA